MDWRTHFEKISKRESESDVFFHMKNIPANSEARPRKSLLFLVTQYWKSLDNVKQLSAEFAKLLTATTGFVKTICSSVCTEYSAPTDVVT